MTGSSSPEAGGPFPAARSRRSPRLSRPRPPTRRRQPSDHAGARSMISKFFIERPVLANVLAIVLVLIGGVALFTLPVAQYPNVVPPTVQVTTRYPGASAQTVIDTVALPIELQVNGVPACSHFSSPAPITAPQYLREPSRSDSMRIPTRPRSTSG